MRICLRQFVKHWQVIEAYSSGGAPDLTHGIQPLE